MDVNLAAAKEIARQLRLRDLGGIVIDFIDLQGAEQAGAVRRNGEADGRRQGQAHGAAAHEVRPDADYPPAGASRGRRECFGRLPDMATVRVKSSLRCCWTRRSRTRFPSLRRIADISLSNWSSVLMWRRSSERFLSLRRRWEWKYKVRLQISEDQSVGIVEVHYHDKKDNDLIQK